MSSPVKVAAQKGDMEDMERENDRRFSSNFVVASTKHKSEMEDQERSKHKRQFSSNFVPLPAAHEEEAKVQDEEDNESPRPLGRCLCTHVRVGVTSSCSNRIALGKLSLASYADSPMFFIMHEKN